MKIRRIFVKNRVSKLWAVCYPEDRVRTKWIDVFRKLMSCWNDTAYLQQFFINNKMALSDPFWMNISIDEAIDKVMDEAYDFDMELKNMDEGHPLYQNRSLSDIFKNFHSDMYVLDRGNLYHKKAKPNKAVPMTRIYALEFDDAYIITGGLIKLTEKLDKEVADEEKAKMDKVRQYLKSEGVISKEGLTEL
jgi:hypothetical protein